MSNDFTTQFAIRLPDGGYFLSPHSDAVVTWSEEAGAQYVLEQLRAHAAAMGINDYLGVVVHRYCTPFIGPADEGAQLIDELQTWLKQQGGPR
jgi:hypothetical protein